MLFFNAHRNNQGFTLAETAVITVIVGILATLVAPGLIRWVQQKQLDDALVSLQGALREAQTQAVRRSTTCAVLIPDGNGQTLTKSAASTNGCLLSDRTLPNGVNIISNLQTNPKRISFSFRGNTTNSATIVLYRSDTTALKMRCLAISNGLGIMRTGRYSGSTASAADVTGTCTSNQ